MLLAVDIGNTNVKLGVFDGGHLIKKLSVSSGHDSLDGDLLLSFTGMSEMGITSAIICSVVPDLDSTVAGRIETTFGVRPVLVTSGMDLGLDIRYLPIEAAGTDRIVNSFAAAVKYGVPCIVCSFGTALTIDVVTAGNILSGGLIAPGLAMMSRALHEQTAKLPEVCIVKPDTAIQVTTEKAIQAGVVYGYFGLVNGLIERVRNETGDDAKIVATGGGAAFVMENTAVFDIIDSDLLLNGLSLIYERLQTGKSV